MDQNCHVETIQKAVLDSVLKNADTTLLAVSGMGCVNCAARVRNGLVSLEGVYHAEIYLNMGLAEVYFDSKKVTPEMLVHAVADSGNDGRHHYEAQVVTRQTA
ncbi:MAG: heavy-metal-associated domain-containing protein [Chloroflexi bacterium]|nr:heavy-metal-associated domain-containing protein [Chloroflexota bacterium]